ncbi:MAG: sulfotransferase [Thiogranum sp.]
MKKPPRVAQQLDRARALLQAGKLPEAVTLLRAVLSKKPGNAGAQELMAEVAVRNRDLAAAAGILQNLLAANPDNHLYHTRLAVVYALQALFPQAAAELRRALALKPDYLPAQLDLCKVTREMGHLDESIRAGLAAVQLDPDDARAHSGVALSFERFGLHRKAHEHYCRAAELSPDDPRRQFACGFGYLGAGDKDKAKHYFQRVLELSPNDAQAHWMLARLQRYASTDHADFQRLQQLLDDPSASDDDRSYLHFALGKMYEDCERYDEAFGHYAAGNSLENSKYHYRPQAWHERVDALIETFSADLLASLSGAGNPSRKPLFIVGMPRSGTSLVEQILASHPQVYGAGELSWLVKTEHDLPAFLHSARSYPACIREMQAAQIDVVAGKYLDYLDVLAEHRPYTYVSDKMPGNYERIGLIALLFPQARIIHCRRDPLDNAVSQFSLLFQGALDYSHDLFNIGAHYAGYERLMTHWRNLIPERILDISYEAMVADHEGETRRMLEFLELPWDPDCLSFFESRRTVRTSSDLQVRTPIYTSAIGRWKHYEKYLEPLRRGLRWPDDNAEGAVSG